MIIRYWFYIAAITFAAYGAYSVLYQGTSHALYAIDQWQYYFYVLSPWVLLYGSAKAWHQNFVWRRMLVNRYTPPVLSRGEYRTLKNRKGVSILEYACIGLFLLALAAILKQFSVSYINWWIGSFIGAWMCLKWTIRSIK